MLAKKYTLLIDEKWETELIEKFYNFVEDGEVFQLLDEDEVELCDDCQIYLTNDSNEVVMDTFRCDSQKEYCLNCCGCDDHKGEAWYA